MKKIILFAVILALATTASVHSQPAITSYSIYALGINTNKERKFSGELKTFLNRGSEDILFEVSGMYNFKRTSYHQFSAGLGINFAPFASFDQVNSITIPMQLEIFPLQNFKQLSVIFEIAPEIYIEDGSSVRHLWGLRYSFHKK